MEINLFLQSGWLVDEYERKGALSLRSVSIRVRDGCLKHVGESKQPRLSEYTLSGGCE